jgi:hypothetical protein
MFIQLRLSTILLIVLVLSTSPAQAQKVSANKIPVDTAQIMNHVTNFVHLLYKLAAPDSLVELCGFPFYLKDYKFKKIFPTRASLHAFIKRAYAKDKYGPFRYRIDSVYKPSNCADAHIKAKNYCCVTVKIHFPDMGEGKDGNYQEVTFFVITKSPYKIVGGK